MRILLVSTNRSQLPMPVMPMGACIVAQAAEDAGHSVELLDLMFASDPLTAVQAALASCRPDVIGLSVRNIDNNAMRGTAYFLDGLSELLGVLRQRTEVPIVLGGAALGVMPEQMLSLAPGAVAVVGDGGRVFPRLLERLARRESFHDLPGIAWLEEGIYRRNALSAVSAPEPCPVPDYARWLDLPAYRAQMSTAPLQTKTGCPFDCVYCTYPRIEGRVCRLKEPDSVAAAVANLAAAGLRDIEFVDSVFNAPIGHAMEVCAALARTRHGARLHCLELNPRGFDDTLVEAMERAGFVSLGITLESASDPVLQGLRKGFTSRQVHAAAEVVRRHRLPCAWIFLLGGPGETQETVRETLRFARDCIRPRDVAFFNTGLRIYPGTELEAIARAQGILSQLPEEMLSPVFYVSPDVDAAWIENELKHAMKSRMNFIDMSSMGHSLLPTIHRVGHRLGLRPPLWRYTGIIRRGLRLVGMDV